MTTDKAAYVRLWQDLKRNCKVFVACPSCGANVWQCLTWKYEGSVACCPDCDHGAPAPKEAVILPLSGIVLAQESHMNNNPPFADYGKPRHANPAYRAAKAKGVRDQCLHCAATGRMCRTCEGSEEDCQCPDMGEGMDCPYCREDDPPVW